MVNSLINKNIIEKDYKLVDFVVYEFIEKNIKISEQLNKAKNYNFNIVYSKNYKNINEIQLSELLKIRKKDSIYDIDGIIVTDDNIHAKNTSNNPKYSFAFKDILLLDYAISE